MLLSTITVRIQSKPAAGEMVEQSPITPCPAMPARPDRPELSAVPGWKRLGFCRAQRWHSPFSCAGCILGHCSRPGGSQQRHEQVLIRSTGQPAPPAPGLPLCPVGPLRHWALWSLGVSATTHGTGGWSNCSHGSLWPRSLCSWEAAAGASAGLSK